MMCAKMRHVLHSAKGYRNSATRPANRRLTIDSCSALERILMLFVVHETNSHSGGVFCQTVIADKITLDFVSNDLQNAESVHHIIETSSLLIAIPCTDSERESPNEHPPGSQLMAKQWNMQSNCDSSRPFPVQSVTSSALPWQVTRDRG
jgi:hypothetical protein